MIELIQGDALTVLQRMKSGSVHCCITSPPYFGLRDYGVADQIGLEPTVDAYVKKLVGVFSEVRRVLRDDGTLWLVLGDSYAQGEIRHRNGRDNSTLRFEDIMPDKPWNLGATSVGHKVDHNLKPKNLIGIPWRVAFALQSDGWHIRCDIIWSKPNPLPESVRDRPTKSHEYVFLMSKSQRYYYGVDAVRENLSDDTIRRNHRAFSNRSGWSGNPRVHGEKCHMLPSNPLGRNRRSVWTIATHQYTKAHFATYPEKLVEPCILAGCPAGGTVLDTFAGACTTGVVAMKLGRKFIGIEINPDYLKLGRNRLMNTTPSLSFGD